MKRIDGPRSARGTNVPRPLRCRVAARVSTAVNIPPDINVVTRRPRGGNASGGGTHEPPSRRVPFELEEYPSGRARERLVRRRLSGGEDDEEGMTIARPRSTAGSLTRDGRIGLGAMRKSESRIPLCGRRRLPERRARTTTRAAGRCVGVVAAALVGVAIPIGEGGGR